MMFGCRPVVVVPCLVIALLSYGLYLPIPSGFAKPLSTRLVLTVIERMISVFQLMEKVGIADSITLMRRMEHLMQLSHPNLNVEDTKFDGVKVRIYQPRVVTVTDRPAIIYFHGGGWTYGSADLSDVVTAKLAEGINGVVVSVQYRLAPENIFPAAFDDCVTATRYLLKNAKDLGVNPSRVALAGDSAGGNLAAAVALKLRDTTSDLAKVKLQVLLYPALQAVDVQTPSHHFTNTPILSRHRMAVFWLNYAQGHSRNAAAMLVNNHTAPEVLEQLRRSHVNWSRLPPGFNSDLVKERCKGCGDAELWAELENVFMNPYFAPLMADELGDLPTAYVITANNDLLRDDGAMYADRLREAGNMVTHVYQHVGFHDMLMLAGTIIPEADQTLDELMRFLNKHL